MTEKERLYVKECDCPEIQKGWKPKFKDEVYSKALRRIGMVRLCMKIAEK